MKDIFSLPIQRLSLILIVFFSYGLLLWLYILNKKKKKKKKLDGFYFSVISWFLRNPTYNKSIFIALVYVHHTHLFSTRMSFQAT